MRDADIRIRLTAEERRLFEREAEAAGLTLSRWARERLGSPPLKRRVDMLEAYLAGMDRLEHFEKTVAVVDARGYGLQSEARMHELAAVYFASEHLGQEIDANEGNVE